LDDCHRVAGRRLEASDFHKPRRLHAETGGQGHNRFIRPPLLPFPPRACQRRNASKQFAVPSWTRSSTGCLMRQAIRNHPRWMPKSGQSGGQCSSFTCFSPSPTLLFSSARAGSYIGAVIVSKTCNVLQPCMHNMVVALKHNDII
jgi:anti-sigma factor RsiW